MAEKTMCSFFKVMMNDFTQQVTLPPQLVSKGGNTLPKHAKLRMSNGVTWDVEIRETNDGGRCLTSGWNEFVKDMVLVEGDYVCFYPNIDGMTFDVVVFGTNCCEKNIPVSGSSVVSPNYEVQLKHWQTKRLPLRKAFVMRAGLFCKKEVALEYGPTKKTSTVQLDNRTTVIKRYKVELALGWSAFQKGNGLKVEKTYSFTFNTARNVIQVHPVNKKVQDDVRE